MRIPSRRDPQNYPWYTSTAATTTVSNIPDLTAPWWNTGTTAASATTLVYGYTTNPCSVVCQDDVERLWARAEARADLGIEPSDPLFERWWQDARMERARGRRDRDQVFASWVEDHPEEVRAVRRQRRHNPPYPSQENIEAGFIRQRHPSGEVVWWRVEVNFETGRPRVVQLRGRPSRAERREFRRVQARQEALRVARAAIRALEEAERLRLDQEAQERAEVLLTAHLTIRQRASLARHGFFQVRGSEGGLYEVHHSGQAGNVYLIEHGRRVRRYCIHPYGGREPNEDVWLAQKLMLETNEREFLRIANASMMVGLAA